MKNKIIIALVIVVGLSSCNIYKPYKTPEVDSSQLYRTDSVSTDTTNIALVPWKEIFTDPKLQSLIDSAMTNNFDYRSAILGIEQARASFARSQASFYPSLTLAANGTLGKVEGYKHSETYQAAASSSWEIDIFGRLRSAKRGAKAAMMKSIAYKRAVETQMVSGLASGYYTLISLDRQLAISEQTVVLWSESVRTMEALLEAGQVTQAAVSQAKANLHNVKASIQDLKYNIRVTENSLRLLVAKPAGDIERSSFDKISLTPELAIGVPAQLLANRPDVMVAEADLAQYHANTNVARASFYPQFTLTGTGGYANSISGLSFDVPTMFASAVAGLTQPIFQLGTNRARLRIAKAQEEQAFLAFQKALISAGNEVSNALYSCQTNSQKLTQRSMAVASLSVAAENTAELLIRGGASYLEVLTAQQSLLSAQLAQVNDTFAQANSVITLYHSLGGGWQR